MCCELVFFLYNASTKCNISEDYKVEVGASGLQEDLSKIGSTKAIFKNIPIDNEKMENIHIFCRLARTSANQDFKMNSRPYESIRVPFCWAVSPPIHELPNRLTEFSWTLYQPSQGFPFDSVPTGKKNHKKCYFYI